MEVNLSDYCYALLQIRCAQEVLIVYDFKGKKLFKLFLHRKISGERNKIKQDLHK